MKGSYILLLELPHNTKISVGKIGEIDFKKGLYTYIGSALNGIEGRLARHLRKNKKFFWHIDYLLKYANIVDIYYKLGHTKEECRFAININKEFNGIPNFGSSDCKCKSHLFYSDEYSTLLDIISKLGMMKFDPGNTQ